MPKSVDTSPFMTRIAGMICSLSRTKQVAHFNQHLCKTVLLFSHRPIQPKYSTFVNIACQFSSTSSSCPSTSTSRSTSYRSVIVVSLGKHISTKRTLIVALYYIPEEKNDLLHHLVEAPDLSQWSMRAMLIRLAFALFTQVNCLRFLSQYNCNF